MAVTAVPPSPKFHEYCVMVPVATDMLVKVVTLPRHAVSALKFEVGSAMIVTVVSFVPGQFDALVTFNTTVYVPGPEKRWIGFFVKEMLLDPEDGSPKSQCHVRIFPPPFGWDKSLNWMDCCAQVLVGKLKLQSGDGTSDTT